MSPFVHLVVIHTGGKEIEMPVQSYETVIGLNICGNYAALVQHWRADITGGETPFEVARDIVTVGLITPGVTIDFLSAICNLMGDDCFVSSARARMVSGGGGAAYVTVYPAADWVGAFGGDVDGAQVAGFMLGYTDGGAGLFAKNWIPGVSQDALVDGRFTSTYVAAATEYQVEWLNGLTGAYQYLPVLKHGSPVATYNQIVHAQLGATPGTIRRRLVPV